MSNTLTIQTTKFTNVNIQGEEHDTTFGIRVFDVYGKFYENSFDTIHQVRELFEKNSIFEILDLISSDDIFWDNGLYTGVDFNGNYFDLEEIKENDYFIPLDYQDENGTCRKACGCTEANVLDGNHNVCQRDN